MPKLLYERCAQLFAEYPLAASEVDHRGPVRSMVLMVQHGGDGRYFVLAHNGSRPSYSLWIWPAGDIVDIEADCTARVPEAASNAVTNGVPIPRDGSVFGCISGDAVTALVVVYADYTPAVPEPGWAVMPRVGVPETQWPSFTGEGIYGQWSWERCRDGSIVSLAELIAGTPDTVFWADTAAIIGSDCCVVARDVASPEGYALPRGCYAYYEALLAGKPVPSPAILLADQSKTDLSPRFRQSAHSEDNP